MEIEGCVEKTLVKDRYWYTKTKEKKYTHFCGFFAGRSSRDEAGPDLQLEKGKEDDVSEDDYNGLSR